MNHNRVLAVNCGASHVDCGIFSGENGNRALERCATKRLDVGGPTEDDWLAAIGAALRELVRSEHLRGPCVLGLPGHLTFNREFHVPRAAARQERKLIEFEQCQGIAAAGEPMVWCHVALRVSEGGREMMLAAAKRRVVERIGGEFVKAGLYPEAVLPAWMVLLCAMREEIAGKNSGSVLSVGGSSSRFVAWNSAGVHVRTIPVGGGLVTQRLEEDLQTDHSAADRRRLQECADLADRSDGERERAVVKRTLDQFVRRLCAELLRTVPLSLPFGDPARPTVLQLAGDGARAAGFSALLAEKLRLHVEQLDMRSHPGLLQTTEGSGTNEDAALLADLAGLAEYAATRNRSEGNLLPSSLRQEMCVRRRWPLLSAAALLAVVAPLAPIWTLRRDSGDVGKRADEIESRIAVLRRIDTANRSRLAQFAETNQRIAALRKLDRARSGWIALLGDLQDRLASVQDVWLDRLRVGAADVENTSEQRAGDRAALQGKRAGIPAGRDLVPSGERLLVAGRLLDVRGLAASAGSESCPRSELLLAALRASPLIAAVEDERFIAIEAGLWRFEIALRLSPNVPF